MKNYSVFVINISDKRWEKYSQDKNNIYNRFLGVDGSTLDLEEYKKYVFYWNKSEKGRRGAIGCSESHMNMMKYIYENKLNHVIVIEDDAIIDFSRLDELDDIKGFCFIGGRLQATKLKDDNVFQSQIKKTLELKKLNKIDTDKYIVTGAHGLYFDTWETAKDIFDDIHKQTRRRISDVELKRIQKNRPHIINQFIYPAISTLHLPDAQEGFTYNKDTSYNLKDNNYHY